MAPLSVIVVGLDVEDYFVITKTWLLLLRRILAVESSLEAESFASLHCLQLCHTHGLLNTLVEMGSHLLFQMVTKSSQIPRTTDSVLRHIFGRQLLEAISHSNISFVNQTLERMCRLLWPPLLIHY
ncbi:hypothetical protein ACH5RR_009134 [Cinchona calisaya]|uniref:RNase H type-1 domain-containing protein n=1 Tax=Cinchona calisaya TaxID=153742 RepID=A0ABD3ADK8_9GENT